MADAAHVGYFEDLKTMPEEGPFVLCEGPVGGRRPRIEQVRGPDGVGCPIMLHDDMYRFMKENHIPRDHEGACKLNTLYVQGAFVWDEFFLLPKEAK